MKILIATESYPPETGGPATYAYNLVESLVDRGHKIRILSYSSKAQQKWLKYKVHTVSKRWPIFLRHFVFFVRLLFLSYQFPIIYALGPVSSGWPSLWVKKFTGKKLVVRVVNDVAWEKGMDWQKVFENVDHFQKEKTKGALKWVKLYQNKVINGADLVIVHCHYIKKLVCDWLNVPGDDRIIHEKCTNKKIKIIYNAINSQNRGLSKDDAQKEIGISGDILLTVARLIPRKGISLLIRLMPTLLRENPNFKLVVVGGGNLMNFYKILIGELGLDKHIYLVGSVPNDMIEYYFSAASLFLLNSKQEGMPMTILEALKFRVPIIASNVGGISELIDNNINGILVEYNDHEAWLDAILKLWRDKPTQECFKACNLASLGVFSKEKVLEETENALQSVLNK